MRRRKSHFAKHRESRECAKVDEEAQNVLFILRVSSWSILTLFARKIHHCKLHDELAGPQKPLYRAGQQLVNKILWRNVDV